jgi:hypothetical protein
MKVPIFVIRFSPWAAALAGFFLLEAQWRWPHAYPWPLLAALAAVLVSAAAIAWKRVSWLELANSLCPTVLMLVGMGLTALHLETLLERQVLTGIFIVIPLLALELLFLLAFDPRRYPVNGFSRFNVALVPLCIAAAAFGLAGLVIFVQVPAWTVVIALALLSALLLFVTSHPTASPAQRRRWTLLGGLAGLHAGICVALLPVGLGVLAALAALMVGFVLRIRRYAYQPIPPRSLALGEGLSAGAAFLILLLTARWA